MAVFKVISVCFTLAPVLVGIQISKKISQFLSHLPSMVRDIPFGGNRFSKHLSEIWKYIRSIMFWIHPFMFSILRNTKVTFLLSVYDCHIIVKHLEMN